MSQRPENREIYLVAVAKNEDPYIDEWLDYHFKIGFEKIVIFANDWNYVNDDPRVTVAYRKGNNIQSAAYNEFFRNNKNKFWWVAYWDLDEFLVLHKHKNVEELFLEYDDVQAIGINWALFGSNGHEKVIDNDYQVLNRFTKRATEEDHNKNNLRSIKTCMRYTNKCRGMEIHHCYGITHLLDRSVNNAKPGTPKVNWDVAQINHYWIKSLEEAEIKMKRGRATTTIKRDWNDFFIKRDKFCNSVYDYSAIEFYYGKEYVENLKKRENK